MSEPIKNNTPEERLTYQLCIEIINKIAKEYGDLNVPGILDPLIAERIDLAIQDVLAKLEDLDSKTDIKLEDINKIKEDCQNIVATGNELSASFDEAFILLESIVAHVNDIESSTELKAQQIQTIKEAIEVLEQNINSLVDRAELIESNIDNLYRNFVKDYNHSVQIYDSVREWKEQIEKNILLSKATLEELKILFPQAQEINRKLEEAIAIGLDLEEEIINAKQTIIETGEKQVDNMNVIKNDFDTLVTEKTTEFTGLADEKTEEITTLATEKLNNLLNFLQTQDILDLKALSQLKLEAPLINLITQNLQIDGTPYMEMGVNDNGHYVKFASGLLITVAVSRVGGGVKECIYFPYEFIERPTILNFYNSSTYNDTTGLLYIPYSTGKDNGIIMSTNYLDYWSQTAQSESLILTLIGTWK